MQTTYPWLNVIADKLSSYQQQQRLPSALMLQGDEGLGLATLARDFSKQVFCLKPTSEGSACCSCSSCLLFDAGNYPDYINIKPDEGKLTIKIDAIRQLSERLALSSQFANPRIVIINPIDALLHQASNSLLKTLEEPSENTCLILIAHQLSKIPMTIRSRCQIIKINATDKNLANRWLKEEGCEQSLQYLMLANDRPLLAYDLWKKDGLEHRRELFDEFVALIKGQLDPLIFAEKCLSKKEFPIIKWLTSWLADAVKYKYSSTVNQLLNVDLGEDLKVLPSKLHLNDLYGLLDKLGELAQLEASQLNHQLLLEEFSVDCFSASKIKGHK